VSKDELENIALESTRTIDINEFVPKGDIEPRLSLVLQARYRGCCPGSFGVLACPERAFSRGDVFRRVFERVVEACIAAGLVGGEGFAVDASLIAADANKQRSIAGQDWRRDRDPARSSRAVKEYLATLDDTAWGAASDVVPKFVSPSDPAAQWTGAHKGPAFFAYSDNYSST